MSCLKCYNCIAFNKCLNNALENISVKCLDFGKLKAEVDEAISKFNSIGLPYPLSEEEIKSLIFFSSTTES